MNQTPRGKLHTPFSLWYKRSSQEATSGHSTMVKKGTSFALVLLLLFLATKYTIGHVCVTGPPGNGQPTEESTSSRSTDDSSSTVSSTTTTSSSSSAASTITSTSTTTATPTTKSKPEEYPGTSVDDGNACK